MLYKHNPNLFLNTFENIFSCREIGNKTHGDLAEIAVDEFINQYMYDYSSSHIGKENYRNKKIEEDLKIIKKFDNEEFYISLKCYGKGYLQLSTDKNNFLFPMLKQENDIKRIMRNGDFIKLLNISTLSLIYDEKQKQFNILIFNKNLFLKDFSKIKYIDEKTRNRKHPIYIFQNGNDEYIAECRYGGKTANALQRGLWTHTEKAKNYFRSVTGGWKQYNVNKKIKDLFSKSLISTQNSHEESIRLFQKDIDTQKSNIKK